MRQAIHAIESVRADLRTVALKAEFLADKRDVYDALIALRLSDPAASPADLFELIEAVARGHGRIDCSRARTV